MIERDSSVVIRMKNRGREKRLNCMTSRSIASTAWSPARSGPRLWRTEGDRQAGLVNRLLADKLR